MFPTAYGKIKLSENVETLKKRFLNFEETTTGVLIFLSIAARDNQLRCREIYANDIKTLKQ